MHIVDRLSLSLCVRLFLTSTGRGGQIELRKNAAICLGEVIFMAAFLQGNGLMTFISQSAGIQIHYAT